MRRRIDAPAALLYSPRMAKKTGANVGQASRLSPKSKKDETGATPVLRPSALLDTRVVYCGDNLEPLAKLPDACVDLIYIDPPFNSKRNYGQRPDWHSLWGETKEKRAFEGHHENTKAYIDYLRPRCVQLARVLKQTGSFYYHCDWHASHYVKVMLDQIFGKNNFQNEIVWKRNNSHNDAEQREQTKKALR
jgi:DNA modification methylase